MKKVVKIIVIVLLVLATATVVLLKYLGSRPAVPNDYQQRVKTGGGLEAKYLANGKYEVSVAEQAALQDFKKYTIFYPSDLDSSNKRYPVIVICNGSGTPISKYPAVPKHYASWGFIVIGTEEEYAWDGFGAEMSVRHLQRLNDAPQTEENRPNIFFHKIDLNNVGIVGHSQGGVGVLNAITAQEHKDIYKAAVSLSPTNQELAHNLEWDYHASLVHTPIVLISGEGGGDDWVVTGEQLEHIYRDIADNKIMFRRKDTAHNEVLYSADGYVTAWFMWRLQGDKEAAAVFSGSSPELADNPMYQDVKIDLGM